MAFEVGTPLPEYRVKAINNSAESSNLIQNDEYARRYGFGAGLVPGISIYAYMSRSLVEFMGKDWLERGSAEVSFVRPVYEGEEIRVSGSLASVSEDGLLGIDYLASNNQGVPCGIGKARLSPRPPASEPAFDNYPAGRGKLRRPISLETLKVGDLLTPITTEFNWNIHWQYCQKSIRDHHPIYDRTLHPGWLATQADLILAANYDVAAWIDVSTEVQNYHVQEEECTLETRGRVQGKFERNGDHFIVLDIAVFSATHCLQVIHHTVIFRIAPQAA
jgi:hypothetical protein